MAEYISPAARAHLEQVWPLFLARVAAGELIKDITADLGLTRGMYRRWIADGGQARRTEYDTAREASADAYADMALDEAMSNYRGDMAAHARTRIDTLKWAARIRNPRLYSDKAQLDVNVRTIDLTRIIQEANERLAHRAPRVLEHETLEPLRDAAIALLPEKLRELL